MAPVLGRAKALMLPRSMMSLVLGIGFVVINTSPAPSPARWATPRR